MENKITFSPIVCREAKKLRIAPLVLQDETYTYHLKRVTASNNKGMEVGHYYLIKVEDYIINPPPNFNLHTNWNKNIIPKDKYMKCEICQIMGKMIRVTAMGFDNNTQTDTNNLWCGWLPLASITVIREI